jgi:hypothetical protein
MVLNLSHRRHIGWLFHPAGIAHLVLAFSPPAAAAAEVFKLGHLRFTQVFLLFGLLTAAAAGVKVTGMGGITQMSFFGSNFATGFTGIGCHGSSFTVIILA